MVENLGEKEDLAPFKYVDGDEMSKVYLWDLSEDIGYVDEVDVAIVKILG